MKLTLFSLLYILCISFFCYAVPMPSALILRDGEPRGAAIRPMDSLYYQSLEVTTLQGEQSGVAAEFGYLNAWMGRQVKVVVNSAAAPYEVVVNDRSVAYSGGSSSPLSFNITRELIAHSLNRVELRYATVEGIETVEGWASEGSKVGEIYLISVPTLHVSDVWQSVSMTEDGSAAATITVALSSTALGLQQGRVDYQLLDSAGNTLSQGSRDVQAQLRGGDTITLSTIVPYDQLWAEDSPRMVTLSLVNRRGGRVLQRANLNIGLRSMEYTPEGEMIVNGDSVILRAKRVDAAVDIEELQGYKQRGYNTFVVGAGRYREELFSWADSVGVYLIPTAAINSSKASREITVGGNPTNDPQYRDVYIERAEELYVSTRIHPSVVGFAIAEESLNGDNLYQSYLYLKEKKDSRPILYFDGRGEWNSDNIKILWE